jgi:hypothetical protein
MAGVRPADALPEGCLELGRCETGIEEMRWPTVELLDTER